MQAGLNYPFLPSHEHEHRRDFELTVEMTWESEESAFKVMPLVAHDSQEPISSTHVLVRVVSELSPILQRTRFLRVVCSDEGSETYGP